MPPSIAGHVELVARQWRLVSAVAAAALAGGIAYGLVARPVYRSTVLLQVERRDAGGALAERPASPRQRSFAAAELEVIRSRAVLGSVVDELHLEVVPETRGAATREQAIDELRDTLGVVETAAGSGIVRLTLDGPDPGRLAATLDAIASACVRQEVERGTAEVARALELLRTERLGRDEALRVAAEAASGRVRILDAATRPVSPIAPGRAAIAAVAALLGLALGVVLALVRNAHARVAEPDAIERATGVAVWAAIPRSEEQGALRAAPDGGAIPVLARVRPGDPALEALRGLRTSVLVEALDAPSKVLAVSGAAAGEGASFVTVNVARLLGDVGRRVVVVDCDLRAGELHRFYGLGRSPGLADVVTGQARVFDAIRETGTPNVRILTAGTATPERSAPLAPDRFRALLDDLSRTADLVILDAPPALPDGDGMIAAGTAGIRLLVVRAGQHRLRELVDVVRRLDRNGVSVNGIVLNAVEAREAAGNPRSP